MIPQYIIDLLKTLKERRFSLLVREIRCQLQRWLSGESVDESVYLIGLIHLNRIKLNPRVKQFFPVNDDLDNVPFPDYYSDPPTTNRENYPTEPKQIAQLKLFINALYFAEETLKQVEAVEFNSFTDEVRCLEQLYHKTAHIAYITGHLVTDFDVNLLAMFGKDLTLLYDYLEKFRAYTQPYAQGTKRLFSNVNGEIPNRIGAMSGKLIKQMNPKENTDYSLLAQWGSLIPPELEEFTKQIQKFSMGANQPETGLTSQQFEALQASALRIMDALDKNRGGGTVLSYLPILKDALMIIMGIVNEAQKLNGSAQELALRQLKTLKQKLQHLHNVVDKITEQGGLDSGLPSQLLLTQTSIWYETLISYLEKAVKFDEKDRKLLVLEDADFINTRVQNIINRISEYRLKIYELSLVNKQIKHFFDVLRESGVKRLSEMDPTVLNNLSLSYRCIEPYMGLLNPSLNQRLISIFLHEEGIDIKLKHWFSKIWVTNEPDGVHDILKMEHIVKRHIKEAIHSYDFDIKLAKDLITNIDADARPIKRFNAYYTEKAETPLVQNCVLQYENNIRQIFHAKRAEKACYRLIEGLSREAVADLQIQYRILQPYLFNSIIGISLPQAKLQALDKEIEASFTVKYVSEDEKKRRFLEVLRKFNFPRIAMSLSNRILRLSQEKKTIIQPKLKRVVLREMQSAPLKLPPSEKTLQNHYSKMFSAYKESLYSWYTIFNDCVGKQLVVENTNYPFPYLDDPNKTLEKGSQVVRIQQLFKCVSHVQRLIEQLEGIGESYSETTYTINLLNICSEVRNIIILTQELIYDPRLAIFRNYLQDGYDLAQSFLTQISNRYNPSNRYPMSREENPAQDMSNVLPYLFNALQVMPEDLNAVRKWMKLPEIDIIEAQIEADKINKKMTRALMSSSNYVKIFLKNPVLCYKLFSNLRKRLTELAATTYDGTSQNLMTIRDTYSKEILLTTDEWEDQIGLNSFTLSGPVKIILDHFFRGLVASLELPYEIHFEYIKDDRIHQAREQAAEQRIAAAQSRQKESLEKQIQLEGFLATAKIFKERKNLTQVAKEGLQDLIVQQFKTIFPILIEKQPTLNPGCGLIHLTTMHQFNMVASLAGQDAILLFENNLYYASLAEKTITHITPTTNRLKTNTNLNADIGTLKQRIAELPVNQNVIANHQELALISSVMGCYYGSPLPYQDKNSLSLDRLLQDIAEPRLCNIEALAERCLSYYKGEHETARLDEATAREKQRKLEHLKYQESIDIYNYKKDYVITRYAEMVEKMIPQRGMAFVHCREEYVLVFTQFMKNAIEDKAAHELRPVINHPQNISKYIKQLLRNQVKIFTESYHNDYLLLERLNELTYRLERYCQKREKSLQEDKKTLVLKKNFATQLKMLALNSDISVAKRIENIKKQVLSSVHEAALLPEEIIWSNSFDRAFHKRPVHTSWSLSWVVMWFLEILECFRVRDSVKRIEKGFEEWVLEVNGKNPLMKFSNALYYLEQYLLDLKKHKLDKNIQSFSLFEEEKTWQKKMDLVNRLKKMINDPSASPEERVQSVCVAINSEEFKNTLLAYHPQASRSWLRVQQWFYILLEHLDLYTRTPQKSLNQLRFFAAHAKDSPPLVTVENSPQIPVMA